MNHDFHIRLNAVLGMREIKQVDLAKMCGVSRGFVSMMCAGKKTPGKPVELLLRERLGLSHWNYITGLSDVLSPLGQAGE